MSEVIKMNTALKEICLLRGENRFEVDLRNQNRYRIVVKEKTGASSYCFSTPIYNSASNELVYRRFQEKKKTFIFTGSDSLITVYNGNLIMKNSEGSVTLRLPDHNYVFRDGNLYSESWFLCPTFNGIFIQMNKPSWTAKLVIDRDFEYIRHTSKNFAIMHEEFKPFFTISPLMSFSTQDQVSPVEVQYKEINQREYAVELAALSGETISFEINLYEPKLFQDTTVESLHPCENNAFGSAAFLGKTPWMGEQWLYSRPDFSKVPELESHEIVQVLLHVPCWYAVNSKLEVYAPTARFCSFGSTWENKTGHTEQLINSNVKDHYITFDLTGIFSDSIDRRILYTHGIILKNSAKNAEYTALATGDSSMFPQILEVHHI